LAARQRGKGAGRAPDSGAVVSETIRQADLSRRHETDVADSSDPAVAAHNEPGRAHPVTLARSVEIRASFYQALLNYIRQVTGSETGLPAWLRDELAAVAEGFVAVLRQGSGGAAAGRKLDETERLQLELSQAKDRIINLLTDRANDQSYIARLETQLAFMPDLQAQADRAITLANQAGTLSEELTRVRFELNRAHLSRMQARLNRRRAGRSLWAGLKARFAPHLKDS